MKNKKILLGIMLVLLTTVVSYKIIVNNPNEKVNYPVGFHEHFLFQARELPTIDGFRLEFTDSTESINIEGITEKWEKASLQPEEWGERVTGVKNRLDTNQKVIALTFDACGGPYGNGFDEPLIEFLRKNEIPATLFINSRWIETNRETFLDLSSDPLFTIENHGTEHLPLSIQGGTAWGITGTASIQEVIEEVMINQRLIEDLTGQAPKFFRSGTAFYDEVAVEIVDDLGLTVVNFDILGDAGATYSSRQVKEALLESQPGSIALLHMNQPSSGTAKGVMDSIPLLKNQGFSFVHLHEYPLAE